MKRVFPYHLVFIAAMILDRVAISSSYLGIEQSLRSLFVLLLAATIATLIIQYFVKDWHYTNFIVLMIPIALVAYQALYTFLEVRFPHQATPLGLTLLVLTSMLYALAVQRRIWKSIRNPAKITTYFNLVSIVLLSFQLVRLGPDGYQLISKLSHPQITAIPLLESEFKLTKRPSSPDIYVIVLDGYARQDVLQNIYKYDNSKFIAELEKRNFYVASHSHSNYTQTVYTMASFWNFDYLRPWDSVGDYKQFLFEPIQNSRVFHMLDDIGYTTVSFEGVLSYIQIKNADVYLSNFMPLNDFETVLFVDSPVEPLSNIFDLRLPLRTYKTHRQRTLYQLETLKEIPVSIPGPKIVYAHILAPHPPFLFYADGTAREPERPYTLHEGVDCEDCEYKYWDGYEDQVRFINRKILEVIDSILARSEMPPIILVMGDHGPASMYSYKLDLPVCVWERTSNLYAIFLPGHQRDETLVYSSITPVNSFRVIFNTYFGTNLPRLEDKTYMVSWKQPNLHSDVTSTRDSLMGCTASEP